MRDATMSSHRCFEEYIMAEIQRIRHDIGASAALRPTELNLRIDRWIRANARRFRNEWNRCRARTSAAGGGV
jgi:hypothetical protein